MTERKASLQKITIKKGLRQQKKWEKVFHNDMMSSEDSIEEDNEEMLKVKTLPWRAEIVNKIFGDLDVIKKKIKVLKQKGSRRPEKSEKFLQDHHQLGLPLGT